MNNITRPKQAQRSGSTTDTDPALLTNFAASSQKYMDWYAEVTRFITTRMMRDAETIQAAIGCANGLKLTEIQQAWMSQTVEDYVQETHCLMQMSSDIVASLVASVGQIAALTSAKGS